MVIPYVTTFIVMFICICLMKFRSKPKFFKKPALNSKSALNSDQQKFLAQIKSNRELENKYAVDLKPPSFINKPDTIKNNFEYPVEVKLNQAEKNVKAKFEDRYIGPTGDIDKENFLNYLEPKQLVKPTSFINQEYKTVFEEHKMLEQDADFEATFAQHVTSDTYEKIKALIIEKR